MTTDTPLNYRNLVFYSTFVRSHGPNGTFLELERDLARIRSMGVDVLWLLPVHPIGVLERKGSLGSPYAISDFRAINPEFGSKEDFRRLIEAAHEYGLRLMIDVVFRHTSRDSVLVQTRPHWFHRDSRGVPAARVPDWTDVADLDCSNPDLWDYLIETLVNWASFGVDGFRCDCASLLPEELWLRARAAVDSVNPGVIWLGESVHAAVISWHRAQGHIAVSDSELYRAFDVLYDYDIWPLWDAVVDRSLPVKRYLEILRFQEAIYPSNYCKLRCVENHDQRRLLSAVPNQASADAWTAFQAFNNGAFLIYSGQESAAAKRASIFERDRIPWGQYEHQLFFTKLAALKKESALTQGRLLWLQDAPVIQGAWHHAESSLYGVFNTYGYVGHAVVQLPDGEYEDLLSGSILHVRGGLMTAPGSCAVMRYRGGKAPVSLRCELLDYGLAAPEV